MSLPTDTVLGVIYVDPAYFLANAASFGAGGSVAGYTSDTIKPILAAASRLVDAYCSRTFDLVDVTENHPWNPATRRITPNQPPLVILKKYSIRTSPGTVSAFQLTPVGTDEGGNKVQFGSVYYNPQENYLELASLALAGSLTSSIASLGMSRPSVEITYSSFASVPAAVIAATAWIAGSLLNESGANARILPGIAMVQADDVRISRVGAGFNRGSSGEGATDNIPTIAKILLRPLTKIPIG